MKAVSKDERKDWVVPIVIISFLVVVGIIIYFCLNSRPSDNVPAIEEKASSTQTYSDSNFPIYVSIICATKAMNDFVNRFIGQLPVAEVPVDEVPVAETSVELQNKNVNTQTADGRKSSKPRVSYTKPSQTAPKKDTVTETPNQGTTQKPSQDNVIEVPNNSVTQRPNPGNVIEVPNTGGNQNNQDSSDNFDSSKIRIVCNSNGEIAHVTISGLDSKCVVNWNGVMDSNNGFYYGHTFSSTTITITRNGKTVLTQSVKI